jgi:glutamate-ammonia-ligase adenylyltransferase
VVDRAARASSRKAWLARAGFADAAAAERELGRPELAELAGDEEFLRSVSSAADPDLALASVARLLGAAPDARDLAAALRDDDQFRARLLAVVGFSAPLADHLVRHPDQWPDLRRPNLVERPDHGEVRAALGRAGDADGLRVEYRRRLLQLAALDLTDVLDMAPVSAELAGLAAATLDTALELAARDLPSEAEPCRLAVIGMGKTGGAELNYVSDVDVIFVAEPVTGGNEAAALKTATTLATTMMRLCSEYTAEGTIWPVDAALRPEGKSGPLVRTVASHAAYYQSWAKTWEFQALLKARHVAGDRELADEYLSAVGPLVWRAADRDGFVEDVRAMRRRVSDHVRPTEAERQLKLGPGGLRDVEFAVQLLQLVHGRTDESLRSPNTLEALDALIAGGYVGRADGAVLDEAYRFLRTLEHRIQLQRLRRTHVVPSQPDQLRRLARALGLRHADELTTTWRRHAIEVQRLHEKLFYRPLLTAVARLPGEEARLTPEAARQRLEALGYLDPAGALRHLEALTRGVSRRAAIQRTLLPVLLGWFADGPEPDAGLAGFRKVSDALGDTHWYLRLLRDERAAAERMARVLSSGRYATELLLRAPEAVKIFGDDAELNPRPREPLEAEALGGLRRHDDPVAAIGGVRAMRRRELFRIATADLVGRLPAEAVGDALTAVAEATLAGALDTAVRAVELERREPLVTRLSVIAMGRLGGREMGYASDADVLFVHDPLDGADEQEAAESALAVANEMRRLLAVPSPEPALEIDPNLRPEGRQGPLVRTLASYAAYYDRWGEVWERQALLRAAPCCGDPLLAERFMKLVDPLRWPRAGLTDAQVREIRRIKARVESERLPRGVDKSMHLKLGPGGLADVEWTAQLIQLRHGHSVPELRTTQTRRALDAAVDAELLAPPDRDVLVEAWNMASSVRNALVLVSGRPSDVLPTDVRTLAALSRVVGYGPGTVATFLDDYRRRARRARAVVERIFFQT